MHATVAWVLGLAGWAAAWCVAPIAARAADAAPELTQGLLCSGAIAAAEAQTHIPDEFLAAIGRIESGRAIGGGVVPWPWTVNADGTGHYYQTKQQAIAAVQAFQASGVRSLDVGCMQVSLLYHKDAFSSLDQAFDPAANAAYAARMLLALHAQTGSWPLAAASYHAGTAALGKDYQAKVLAAWSVPNGRMPFRARDGAPQAPVAAPPIPDAAQATGGAAGAPATSFTRTLATGKAPAMSGRSLANYRALPVRVALMRPRGVALRK
jgi:hypothetical protein